jgi:hypothetical protein
LDDARDVATPRYATGAVLFHTDRDIPVRVVAQCDKHRVLVMDEQNDVLIRADTSALRGPLQAEPHRRRP